MTTAVIGVGNIGKVVARELVNGGEDVVLASRVETDAAAVAAELGGNASAASVGDAIAQADAVVFAVWLDTTEKLVAEHRAALAGKVVIDPSNPVAADESGNYGRSLPDGVSAASVIEGLLPPDAHYVKAFGTPAAGSLASGSNRQPRRAVLFYATDDEQAATTVERLISAAGFDPTKAGGLDSALEIEMFGRLHEYGGLDGKLLDLDEAEAAIATVRA
jgi:8-hydroxy-5-deazaflavin:NADPH oxidoreductase